MNTKKLIPELVERIVEAGYDENDREVQTLCIPKIKSGADFYIIAPEGSGKSVALVISTIQKLKKPEEEAPRAIIMVATKEKAFEMEEQFTLLGKRTKLRTFVAFDGGIIQYQKDMIYEGLDVLIGTPARLNELVSITGIPLTKVRLFAVDDLSSFVLNKYALIYRIADNVEKAQLLMFSNEWKDNFNRISERIMKNPQKIKCQ
jgi:ATP-dependent RNA helicase RhlE